MAAPTSLAETFKTTLANGEPSTHGEKRTCLGACRMSGNDPIADGHPIADTVVMCATAKVWGQPNVCK